MPVNMQIDYFVGILYLEKWDGVDGGEIATRGD